MKEFRPVLACFSLWRIRVWFWRESGYVAVETEISLN